VVRYLKWMGLNVVKLEDVEMARFDEQFEAITDRPSPLKWNE